MVDHVMVLQLPKEIFFFIVEIFSVWSDADESIPELVNLWVNIIDIKYIKFNCSFSIVFLEENFDWFLVNSFSVCINLCKILFIK